MNARAIERLRQRFITIAMVAYLLVMLFLGTLINLTNYMAGRKQIYQVLDYLLESEMEELEEREDGGGDGSDSERDREREEILNAFSPEFQHSARYFTAVFDESGTLEQLETEHVSTTDKQADMLAKLANKVPKTYGQTGNYFFKKGVNAEADTVIVLLNCSSQLLSNLRILYITLAISAVGLVIIFILVYLLSYKAVQPEIENVNRQKQFITNASHELKTPLAVIRANTEIEEMINGETEWTQSTMRQIDRLNGLIQNLVMISRAAEKEDRSVMAEINVSQNVEETAKQYESLAHQEEKTLTLDIMPDVKLVADESKIRQLATLLVDNAFKYCDEKGTVSVSLDTLKKGKTVRLTVSNSFADGQNVDYSRYFDRFYREDRSHNVDRGGYGIGLSIAESICQQYGGSISASWKDGMISFVCLLM